MPTVDKIPTETPITVLFKRQRLAEWIINLTQLHTSHYTHTHSDRHTQIHTYTLSNMRIGIFCFILFCFMLRF